MFAALKWTLRFVMISLLIYSLPRTACADSVVTQWDNALLQAIRDTAPGPPMVARAIAIVHTCAYDAWAAYDRTAIGTQFGGRLRRPPSERTLANKNKAISFAAYRALVDLFPQPAEVAHFNALMSSLGYDPTNTSTDPATPVGIGNNCAAAVIAFRHHDGSNQLGDLNGGAPYSDYTGYAPVNTPNQILDPNRWQPLLVNGVVQPFVGAQWFKVIPFALTSASEFRPPAPFQYPSWWYRAQAEQVLSYSAHLTDEQKMIAEYWRNGPNSEQPPGHWCLFAQFVSHQHGYGVDDDVKLFFALGNALLDAGISSWDAKRAYDSVRPITAIHFLFSGKPILAWAGPYQGTQIIDGASWQPYQPSNLVTPPFPEFFSGHSTFSAAGAQILYSYTGSDAFGDAVLIPAGSSTVEPGLTPATDITLSWTTFSDAANQAGISRRYGGIHFEYGDLAGRVVGRLVGAQAWAKALTHFNGTAH